MTDRVSLVRMRKNLCRLSVAEEEARNIPPRRSATEISSLTGWIPDDVREVALREESETRRQALREAIHSLLPHFRPANDPVYICLSSDHVVARSLFLPHLAEENLRQVVNYEIKRLLPFRQEQVYYDCLPIGRRGDKVGVLLFAVPKQILDEIFDALSDFGVKPKGVEPAATALSNYLFYCTGGLSGPALVLGSQDHAWEMIGLNGENNGWGQKPEILFTHWLPQDDLILGPGRELFQTSLRGSTRFFSWGDIADFLPAVDQEPLAPQDLMELAGEGTFGGKGVNHPCYLPAVGAALHGLREATFTVNLLSDDGDEGWGSALSWLNTCLTILFLVGLIVWGASYPIKDEIRLTRLQTEIDKVEPYVKSLRRKEEELQKLRKQISPLSRLGDRRGAILHALDELSRIMPGSAYLSNLKYRDGRIELRGSAENASNLVPILERSLLFKNVRFNAPSTRRRDGRETFSLKADMEWTQGKEVRP